MIEIRRLIDFWKSHKLISHLENISFVILMIKHIIFIFVIIPTVN